MIRAAIFDLDNCIASARAVGPSLYEPAIDAIRKAAGEAFPAAELDSAIEALWYHPLDWIAERHGFSAEMFNAGWEAFAELEVSSALRDYGDSAALIELDMMRFLVTSGFEKLQRSKIHALGIERLFDVIFIDAIDSPDRRGKRSTFEAIQADKSLNADDVIVVGDSAESELKAGRQLGMTTIQTLRPGVVPDADADYQIRSLTELPNLVAALNGA